jgi:eukaryotic-like serine/threonine-protein kinase
VRVVTEEKAPPVPLSPGDVAAGRYEITRELGRGGMGVVYLCLDLVTGASVALKCVFVDRSRSQSNEAIWFQQEARALATLDHPAIVRAHDFGTLPDGSPYLVMDALHGRSIHVWKYLTKIPWAVTWCVIDQALAGLAHAHARGVVHGDLKPSNIMVDPRGGVETPRAYILDLGLAWLLSDHVDPRLELSRPAAPALPFGLGTPGWMAPEQIRRAAPHIGPPTDLYALGSILHELLTGREIFQGTSAEILRAHRDTPLPDFTLPPGVPEGVLPFVHTMLAKRPWHRYRFAADAREVWAGFRPKGPIRWAAPQVRVGDENEEEALFALRPGVPTDRPQVAVAPGLLSLRPSPLVGRESERALLWKHVEEVVVGEGPRQRLVLLHGQAGVGKSKLAEWLCEAVHERGAMYPLRAKYRRVPGPHDGMRGAVTTHFNVRGQSRDVIEQALLNEWDIAPDDEQGRTWVAAAATWLRPPAPGDEPKAGPSGKRFFLDKSELRWVVIRHVLERIAGDDRPLLLWMDDLHLAGATAFQGLLQLCREAPALPMLIVVTARDEVVAANPTAAERLESLTRSLPTTRVSVTPLEEAATRALLRASLPLSPEAKDVAIVRSQGNALFALQLVHAWASSGQLTLSKDHYDVPDEALTGRARTTAELWEERLGVLDEQLRPAAFAASALGEEIHLAALTRLLDGLDIDAGQAIRAMQEAELMLIEQGARLRWPHGLLQEHLFARLIESPDAARVFALAAHVLADHPDGKSRRIVRQRARLLLRAHQEAAATKLVLEHVARSWTRVRDVPATRADLDLLEGRDHGPLEAYYLRWRAETARHVGNLEESRQLCERARLAFQTAGDERNEAHCLRLLANIASDQGVPVLARIEALLALDKFDALGDIDGRAECELLLGEILYLLGDHTQARAMLSRAVAVFRSANDPLRLAQGLILRAFVEQAAGRIEAAKEHLEHARVELDSIGYQLGLAQTDAALGHVEHRAGMFSRAYGRAVETAARFRELDNPRGEAACERLAAMAALDMDDLPAAFRHALATFSLYDQRISDPWGRVEGALLLAQVALAEGGLERADDHLRAAQEIDLDEAEPVQHRHLTAAWLALAQGDLEKAAASIALARAAFTDARRTGDHTAQLIPRLRDLAQGTLVESMLNDWLEFLDAPSSSTSTPLP